MSKNSPTFVKIFYNFNLTSCIQKMIRNLNIAENFKSIWSTFFELQSNN